MWLWLVLPALVSSEIFHLKISGDRRKVIDLGTFGFLSSTSGHCEITVQKLEWEKLVGGNWVKQPLGSAPTQPFGFSLEPRDTINTARYDGVSPGKECFVGTPLQHPGDHRSLVVPAGSTFPFRSGDRILSLPLNATLESSVTVPFKAAHITAGFLSLFFFNCAEETRFTLQVKVAQWNGTVKNRDYLSLGRHELPLVYTVFFLAHGSALLVWLYAMRKNRQYVYKVHWLMAFLVALKALSMLFESVQLHAIKSEGTHFFFADLTYYTFLTLKAVVMFVAILLVGTGWSFIKPFLAEKEKRVLFVMVPLVVAVQVAIVVVETLNEGNASWGTWRDVRRLLDIVVCCAVLLPVVWSIRTLREGASADGKAVRNLGRLRQFRSFYVVLVVYIYYTRIVVVLIRSALHYRWTWVAPVILEAGSLAFYLVSGWKFRPQKVNPHHLLADEDFDDIALRQEIEMEAEQRAAVDEAPRPVGGRDVGRKVTAV